MEKGSCVIAIGFVRINRVKICSMLFAADIAVEEEANVTVIIAFFCIYTLLMYNNTR